MDLCVGKSTMGSLFCVWQLVDKCREREEF